VCQFSDGMCSLVIPDGVQAAEAPVGRFLHRSYASDDGLLGRRHADCRPRGQRTTMITSASFATCYVHYGPKGTLDAEKIIPTRLCGGHHPPSLTELVTGTAGFWFVPSLLACHSFDVGSRKAG